MFEHTVINELFFRRTIETYFVLGGKITSELELAIRVAI